MSQGSIIGKANTPTTTVASGVWSLREQHRAQRLGTWPNLDPPTIVGFNSGGAGATTVAIPTHQVGDLIVILASVGSTTNVTVPTASGTVPAWTLISTITTPYNGRLAYFVATATTTTSGSWTGANRVCASVFRGEGASPIGGFALSTNASQTTWTAPGITLSQDNGSSRIVHIFNPGGAGTRTYNAAPTDYSYYSPVITATTQAVAITKGDSTSDGAVSITHSSAQTSICASLEILK